MAKNTKSVPRLPIRSVDPRRVFLASRFGMPQSPEAVTPMPMISNNIPMPNAPMKATHKKTHSAPKKKK